MELEENKVTIATIKQYLGFLVHNVDEFTKLEFCSLKGWFLYSLSLVIVICVPCVLFLIITGLLSGNISWDLLIGVSIIPFIFILPLTLTLTFFYNYKLPKKLRRNILLGLEQQQWDSPILQVGKREFECMKEGFFFRTEARIWENKGREKWYICMIVPYYLSKEIENKGKYVDDMVGYLKERSIFEIKQDMAFFTVEFKIFAKLDLTKSITELLYVMKRFGLKACTTYSPIAILNEVHNTPEILAMTAFDVEIDQRWMDWANKMIEAGFINENMKNFAGHVPSKENHKILKEQMEALICEFNLNIDKDDVLTNYIGFLLYENRLGNRTVLDVIESLNSLYLASGIPELQHFSRLYKAKVELDRTGEQIFWTKEVLSQDNVDSYIINYLSAFYEKRMPEYFDTRIT